MSNPPALPAPTPSPTLTSDLLNDPTNTTALDLATRHPFLQRAGAGTLPTEILHIWLQQDIHYTRAYVRFLGGLLTRLTLPTRIYTSAAPQTTPPSPHEPQPRGSKNLEYRILDLLHTALSNINREMLFFEHTVSDYGLELDATAPAAPITRAYADLFDGAGSGGGTLLRALVVLWATEWCYLEAWTYALKQQRDQQKRSEPPTPSSATNTAATAATKALQEALIPNWTSDGFRAFVQECAEIVDEVAVAEGVGAVLLESERAKEGEGGRRRSGEGGRGRGGVAERTLRVCESAFAHVLWLEGRFWPEVDEVAVDEVAVDEAGLDDLDGLQESRSEGFVRDWE